MNWYLKKEFYAAADGVEAVFIHYCWSLTGAAPDWAAERESRQMPAGEYLKSGVGEIAKYGPAAPVVAQHIHPRLHKKSLKLPNEIWDEAAGAWTGNYSFHYYYETVQAGNRHYSPIYTDEIRTRDITLVDPLGIIGAICTNWSVGDWDVPQFAPMEDPQFIDQFGSDHPLRQHKFYGVEDRESFAMAKKAFVDRLPLPHRFAARVSAPIGANVRVRFHLGNWGFPEAQRWEDYWLTDESVVMTANAAPLVYQPLGTQAAPEPLTVVTPDLLAGNPYADLLPEISALAEADLLREAEELVRPAPVATPA